MKAIRWPILLFGLILIIEGIFVTKGGAAYWETLKHGYSPYSGTVVNRLLAPSTTLRQPPLVSGLFGSDIGNNNNGGWYTKPSGVISRSPGYEDDYESPKTYGNNWKYGESTTKNNNNNNGPLFSTYFDAAPSPSLFNGGLYNDGYSNNLHYQNHVDDLPWHTNHYHQQHNEPFYQLPPRTYAIVATSRPPTVRYNDGATYRPTVRYNDGATYRPTVEYNDGGAPSYRFNNEGAQPYISSHRYGLGGGGYGNNNYFLKSISSDPHDDSRRSVTKSITPLFNVYHPPADTSKKTMTIYRTVFIDNDESDSGDVSSSEESISTSYNDNNNDHDAALSYGWLNGLFGNLKNTIYGKPKNTNDNIVDSDRTPTIHRTALQGQRTQRRPGQESQRRKSPGEQEQLQQHQQRPVQESQRPGQHQQRPDQRHVRFAEDVAEEPYWLKNQKPTPTTRTSPTIRTTSPTSRLVKPPSPNSQTNRGVKPPSPNSQTNRGVKPASPNSPTTRIKPTTLVSQTTRVRPPPLILPKPRAISPPASPTTRATSATRSPPASPTARATSATRSPPASPTARTTSATRSPPASPTARTTSATRSPPASPTARATSATRSPPASPTARATSAIRSPPALPTTLVDSQEVNENNNNNAMNTLDNSGDEEVNPPDSQENNQQLTIRAYDSEEDDGKRTETIRPSTMLPQNIRADGSNEMVL